ncbi:MAG: ribosome maturation factor RimM [Hyphomicrobium sp.]|uniref:ribosome maturation factor RimM n=1 Tax=Hyphomicrobium sp. TaxID=82 RepID=UPI0039E4936F
MSSSRPTSEKSSAEKPHRILVGEIGSAHGIRGDVLIRSFTETPDAIAAYGPLTDLNGSKSFSLRVVRVTDKGIVARIDGIPDRTAAERLRGTKLYIDRAKLPATSEKEFYHADLIGLRAIAPDGSVLGKIIAVQNFGAGDLLELKPLEGETEFIPFEDRWVPSVDLDAGFVIINRPTLTEDDDGDGPEDDGEATP